MDNIFKCVVIEQQECADIALVKYSGSIREAVSSASTLQVVTSFVLMQGFTLPAFSVT